MKLAPGIAALALASLLLAGCGDDSGGDDGDGSSGDGAAAPDSAPTTVPEPTTVWVRSPDTEELYKVDVASGSVAAEVPVDGYITQAAFHDGALWVAAGELYRVDPATHVLEQRSPAEQTIDAFAWQGDRLWAAEDQDDATSLLEIDPDTGEVVDTVELDGPDLSPEDLVPYGDRMIAVNTYDHTIMSIDLETGEFETVEDPDDAIVWDLALVDGVLYASTYDGLRSLDPETLDVVEEIDEEAAFASDPDETGALWVGRAGELGRLDPASGDYQVVSAEVPGAEGAKMDDLKVSESSVWMVFESHVLIRHDRASGQFDPPIQLPAGASNIPVYGLALQ
ncbi:hypothetical protein [Nocardioides sp. SYSU DS0651]|uniref:hypothetical protein n=1 Tax=Nocardioides sp. SYSU DS0651 TaxID=3415955 RepID=UPI003F4BD3E1